MSPLMPSLPLALSTIEERLCDGRIFPFFDEQLADAECSLFGNLDFQSAEAGGRIALFPLVQRD